MINQKPDLFPSVDVIEAGSCLTHLGAMMKDYFESGCFEAVTGQALGYAIESVGLRLSSTAERIDADEEELKRFRKEGRERLNKEAPIGIPASYIKLAEEIAGGRNRRAKAEKN